MYRAYLRRVLTASSSPKPLVENIVRTAEEKYEAKKEWARQKNREITAAAQEIGPLPDVVDPDRKARAFESFQFFCE